MKKIFIVQEIIDGIAECPKLFINEKESDLYYLKLISENYGEEFDNVIEGESFLEENGDCSHDIRYWVSNIEKGK